MVSYWVVYCCRWVGVCGAAAVAFRDEGGMLLQGVVKAYLVSMRAVSRRSEVRCGITVEAESS